MTIDDLAQHAGLPVRTIREYHTMRLLPPPERRGRVGIYGPGHVRRLTMIGKLQRRGYSLAGIRDLLGAWDAGTGLTAVLGVEPGPAALDETPLRLSRDELAERFDVFAGPLFDKACAAGLIQPRAGHLLVRSPALLALVADGIQAGVQADDMLELAAALRQDLTPLAETLASIITDRLILPLLRAGRQPADLAPLLKRSRLLLIQAAASTLTDQLGAALMRRADHAGLAGDADAGDTSGQALRALIEQIRIGAVSDASGAIARQGRPASAP